MVFDFMNNDMRVVYEDLLVDAHATKSISVRP